MSPLLLCDLVGPTRDLIISHLSGICKRTFFEENSVDMKKNRDFHTSPQKLALELSQQRGIVRARDFEAAGVGAEQLRRLNVSGALVRMSRGLYIAADAEVTAHHALALAARRVPGGVICLLSALRVHNLGTQNPFEVWLAVGIKAHKPRLDYPPLRVVRFSVLALEIGIEVRTIEGAAVRLTNPARTVVDCFRYRHKIGLEVALEALREALRPQSAPNGAPLPALCSRDEIWNFAKQLRAARVMRPYLEAFST